MVKKYILGSVFSAFASIAILVISFTISKYPGLGDFILFSLVADTLHVHGQSILYVTKSVTAVALFYLLYKLITLREPQRFLAASSVTMAVQVVMSIGQVVVG